MKNAIRISIATLLILLSSFFNVLPAQENLNLNKFRQLYDELPTPNVYRTAAGTPGHEYYQQQADYVIAVEIDEAKQVLYGEETITYHNNSPDDLTYLWVQLDQNMRAKGSDRNLVKTNSINDDMIFRELAGIQKEFDGGFQLEYIEDLSGKKLNYMVNKTMMRIDLDKPLTKGSKFSFKVKWHYNINDRLKYGGRSGYEYFKGEDNYLYTIAQFYPRMAVYNETEGWQNKQFLGRGEFTLPFGDFEVSITVPSDHIVGSTGSLQNPGKCLTPAMQTRLEQAETAQKPVMIVNEEEAGKASKKKSKEKKTWVYKAENVRDFAFASSRKFIWDAKGVKIGDRTVLAMSYYPKEGNPLWEQYSTEVVAHTIETYSKYTIDYPYPVAISVHTDKIGMEYPMICFNGGRPEKDGTYTERTKFGMIGVITHEVGHFFFPMIINSDERQWTWMDEGLNTFIQSLTEKEWDRDFPARGSEPSMIVDYMKGDKSKITPVMTNSESIYQFGNNAYAKPATALTILRETVMGRELFDYAFKEYCRRWAFKHPTPADFFRTMEDASGTDLDWFWRGWFYTTDAVDLSIDEMGWYQLNTRDPKVEKEFAKAENEGEREYIGETRNRESIPESKIEKDPSLQDFYDRYDPYKVTEYDKNTYNRLSGNLKDDQQALLDQDLNYYELKFSNKGGIPMPVILKFEFDDGEEEIIRIPAEIWRFNEVQISKVFYFEKEVVSVELDPFLETADIDMDNNFWPPKQQPSRFEVFKKKEAKRYMPKKLNPMQIDKKYNISKGTDSK